MELKIKPIQELIIYTIFGKYAFDFNGNDLKQIVSEGAVGSIMKAFK